MLTLALFGSLLAALFLHHTLVTMQYWRRRGIPHLKPLPFFGNCAPAFFRRANFMIMWRDLAAPFLDRGYCGAYQFNQPVLLVWDPDKARQILTKQFGNFHDRGQFSDPEADPLSGNLFNLMGPRWRLLRNKLSPAFSSGKLKCMFPVLRNVSHELCDVLGAEAKGNGGEADMHVLFTRFALDAIGSCAFGFNCNSLRTGDVELLCMVREATSHTMTLIFHFILCSVHPSLQRLLPLKLLLSESTKFFLTLMEKTVEHREKNNIDRKDFVSLMMKLRDMENSHTDPEKRVNFSINVMTAQAFVFFVAGVENIANTAGFCVHQLAQDQELQRRAAEEVRTAIRDHGGQLSYEAVQSMGLLDRIVKEGLRLWPAIGFILRKCNRTTDLGDLVIEKGEVVIVNSSAMHMNPAYFPEPSRFDPDRFTDEAKRSRHPYAYLPFGEGPRICIAERFAMVEMKLVLASLLNDFKFSPSKKSCEGLEFDPTSVIPQPKDGFWVRVERREA